jgi:hypothetical protein
MKSCLLIIVVAFTSPGWAAESVTDLRQARLRAGAWAGLSVMVGNLELSSDTAQSKIRVDALPLVDLGLELWPSESAGVYLRGRLGLGADIATPESALLVGDRSAIGGLRGTSIPYNLHQFEAGARFRWSPNQRADAPGVFAGIGLSALIQTARDQRPSILLDRVIAGPEAAVGVEWPLVRQLWLRLSARGGLPFFVRESPNDSGDPASFRRVGARAEMVVNINARWAAQLYVDFGQSKIAFEGTGSRGAGVESAETKAQFLTTGLWARYTGIDL